MEYLHWENSYIEQLNGVERKNFIQEIRIIKYLYVNGPMTNADICRHLKISAPKSFSILNELICKGVLEKQGLGESNGGRKPDLYGIKNDSLFVLAIDVDTYETKMSIFDGANNNVTGIQTYSIPLKNGIATLDTFYEYAKELIKSSGINPLKLVCVGISMPGLVNARKGTNYTYLNLGEKSIRKILEEKFNRPVFIENDAKAIALAEHRFGLAKGKKDVMVLYLDWGIGLGLILNGKLYRGTSGFAGEFGHIPIVENGALCHCGKRGCLETIASGVTIAKLVKKGAELGKSLIFSNIKEGEIDKIDAKQVVDAAINGDQFAINILSEVGFNLGKGIAILIQLFNPELVILGGRISEARQYITIPIQQSLNTYCMKQLNEQTSIVVSEMGQNVGVMGAVAIVMENIFEHYIKASSK
jgi:glucokinase-like ROK family protein